MRYGSFVTLDGDTITVTFTGENVGSGPIEIANVVMSADGGGGEYKPVQFCTASVSCIVDGLELLDLVARNPLEVQVDIFNSTTGKILFSGYISPNTYNQPTDGIADTLTIECADWLGIAQYVPYKRRDNVFHTMTVSDAVIYIASLISAGAAESCYMADNIEITSGAGGVSTRNYTDLTLSEAYFYDAPTDPPLMPEGTLDVERNALSCYVALSMIAESFRGTWVQVGKSLYLIDTLMQQMAGTQNFRRLVPGAAAAVDEKIGETIVIHEDVFAGTGSMLSILPRYSSVGLSRAHGTVKLTPDIFTPGMNVVEGVKNLESSETSSEAGYVTQYYTQRLVSRVLDISAVSHTPAPGYASAVMIGAKQQDVRTGVIQRPFVYGEEWNTYLRVYLPAYSAGGSTGVSFTLKKTFCQPTVAGRHYALNITMSLAMTRSVDYYYPHDLNISKKADPDKNEKESLFLNCTFGARIKAGDSYYNAEQQRWQSDPYLCLLNAMGKKDDDEWKELIFSTRWAGELAAGTTDGLLEVEVVFSSTVNDEALAIYIRDFAIELSQDVYANDAAVYNPIPEVEYRGNAEYLNEPDVVTLPLSFGFPASDKPLSTTIRGIEYSAITGTADPDHNPFNVEAILRYVGHPTAPEEYDVLDRLYRLANFGDGTEFSFTVRDTHNSITPLMTAFCRDLWAGYKVIAAFNKDIYNNTATITLN